MTIEESMNVKSKLKKFFLRILFTISGNKLAQAWLEKVFYITRILLGMGSGSFPSESGEKAIFDYLKNDWEDKNGAITIFDVGANKGQFLELILKKIKGIDFTVYCFEPVESIFEELKNKFWGSKGVIFEQIGFDNVSHESEIYYDYSGSLRASKFKRDLRHLGVDFNYSEIVKYLTLDQYCSEQNIENIDLLKIDVEGNELNVLKGAKDLLKKKAIKSITFEFGRAQIDSNTFFKDYYYFLIGFGLKNLFRILPNGYLKPISEYNEKNEVFFTTNYLAIMR